MQMKKTVLTITSGVIDDDKMLEVSVKGETSMPFWEHDLKFAAVKALLRTIDGKQYFEDNREQEYYQEIEELREYLNALEM